MRIITGSARGAKLRAPRGMNTRPTADRIKESLFNILQARMADAAVLDLFAGSGALGLEALSRGASGAVFIDSAEDSIKAVRDNARHTHMEEKADIRRGDALTAVRDFFRANYLFDIIFCDPPYHTGLCQQILSEIEAYNILKHNGLFIAEVGADEELETGSTALGLLRSQAYGATTKINIYEYTG